MANNQNDALLDMQNQISALQNQLALANQAVVNLTAQNNQSILKSAKPEKFNGKNARAWLHSLENIFNTQNGSVSEQQKIQYAISYLTDDGLEWWQLLQINPEIVINTFHDFGNELLKYFEPVNRELNARKNMNALKQMGNFSRISEYNKEFTKYLLQIPNMAQAEQIFHYSQGLKNKIRIEIERAQPKNLQSAMIIADRIDNIYNVGLEFGSSSRNQPTPMEIGNINFQNRSRDYKYYQNNRRKFYNSNKVENRKPQNNWRLKRRLNWKEIQQYREENKCFVCDKVGCNSRKHVESKN